MPIIVIRCPKCHTEIVLEDLKDEDILVEELTDYESDQDWEPDTDDTEELTDTDQDEANTQRGL